MISRKEAQSILKKLWIELKNKEKLTFFSEDWKARFPNEPGVYVIWEKGEENPVCGRDEQP